MLHPIKIASFRDYATKKAYNNATPGFERVDRKSVLGNPFPMEDESKRSEVIALYRVWLWEEYGQPEVKAELNRLLELARQAPLTLVCWCAPKACHAEIIRSCLIWMDKMENQENHPNMCIDSF